MESGDLRIFRAVAREGSATKAAEALNYVQSNVTTRIQYLESELGLPLFVRSNRGMALTEAGENLLQYADRILALLDEAARTTKYSEQPVGPLRIGSIETAALTHLLPLFSRYQSEFPAVQLSLSTGGTHSLVQKVVRGELDGAFVYGPIEERNIGCVQAFSEELVLVSEAGKDNRAELLAKPMLFFDVGCTHRTRAEHFLHESGRTSYEIREFGTLDLIVKGVSAGFGVSLLPKSAIAKAAKEGLVSFHQLPEAYRDLPVEFIFRSDMKGSSALLSLLTMIGERGI
ncbi:LysR family transcriptional regulator [Paenibacillus sp. BIHB 4019]|uniref:LysR family transcriptional regulator n=1 Tax=Paenibacillus sp. BIHB 4019 TaxID=1870819 RepID=A0A1B2DEH6_9BACL|nr:LysR family transcriptional regulator [Paenibacillus sp. BIHB 4019]ANY66117.1 LysR family transcriptional regulator [Paenibacillus sp. BIHB 4019]